MFPDHGVGSVSVDPLFPPSGQVLPDHLYPHQEANYKYHIFNTLNKHGSCFCEVSIAGNSRIDLVWVQRDTAKSPGKIVAIEIKTHSGMKAAAHKIESQIEKYRDLTLFDVTSAEFVAHEEIVCTRDVYLFDEVWLLTIGTHGRWDLGWRKDTPEDGWLQYNPFTGRIDFELDESVPRETIRIDFERYTSEAQLTAQLWSKYWTEQRSVCAESTISKPEHREIENNRFMYNSGKNQGGKTKMADLCIGGINESRLLTPISEIWGIEVKSSFTSNVRSQLDDQLPLYCESSMFSNVYLAVPLECGPKAYEYLQENHSGVGLLTFDQSYKCITEQLSPNQIELKKVPVVDTYTNNRYFVL